MEEAKKILTKGLLLLGLLALLNWVYARWFWKEDVAAHSESGELMLQVSDSAEILYVGESSDVTISDKDVDQRTIHEILNAHFPQRRVGAAVRGALHFANFRGMLENVPENSPVHTVVLTVNLRSFGAGWIYSKLETALQKETVLLEGGPKLWRRLRLTFRDYEVRTEEEWHEVVMGHWKQDSIDLPPGFPFRTVRKWDQAASEGKDPHGLAHPRANQPEIALACNYIKGFAFKVDPASNPRTRDLDAIVALAQARGWNLVMNLLPENMEQARQLAGPELAGIMRANGDFLKQRYAGQPGVIFIDQLEALPDEEFIERVSPGEHYRERGRWVVGRRLAKEMAVLFPGEYRDAEPRGALARQFFNDCEGQEVWAQMQTLEQGHAHSGKQASRTEAPAQQFGITFSRPLSALDTTALDSIEVSAWVYMQAASNAAIAWEVAGDSIAYRFDSVQLRSLGAVPGAWRPIVFRRALFPETRKADFIKCYGYNPSKAVVWFDDFAIKFVSTRHQ